jgi:hypothetical protein
MKAPQQHSGDFQTAAIRRLVDVRLKARFRDEAPSPVGAHTDEDIINAFVEGRLEEAQSVSVTAHLVSCAQCLHLTAQLIRFAPEGGELDRSSEPAEEGGPLQRLVEGLSGMVPSLDEDAVFAYQDPRVDDEGQKDKAEPGDDNDGDSDRD